MKIDLQMREKYLLKKLANTEIQIDYSRLFFYIKKGEGDLFFIEKVAYLIKNSNKSEIMNFIYSNFHIMNKFVFYWFLCDYLLYVKIINFSEVSFFNFFETADEHSVVSILLLLRKLKII